MRINFNSLARTGTSLLLHFTAFGWIPPAIGDELRHAYEGNVVPYDPEIGWIILNPCDGACTESLENGHLTLRWPTVGSSYGYRYRIANPTSLPPPPTLWVEWSFRSNHPLGCCFYTCDATFTIQYKGIFEPLFMYGDAAISFSGSGYVLDLEIDELHTYRFESTDGVHYTISVDGEIFLVGQDNKPNGYSSIAMSGQGACGGDEMPHARNEWDFVRFGTISEGEQIIATDPPTGFVDARTHPALDRFTIRYDAPNYVYLNEITVEVTDGAAPNPLKTRRLDNGSADVVEIVLDRPIPIGATTRFTFDDGALAQSIEFTHAPGDFDGDGMVGLSDFAQFQSCFGSDQPPACRPFDFNEDRIVDLQDLIALESVLGFP